MQKLKQANIGDTIDPASLPRRHQRFLAAMANHPLVLDEHGMLRFAKQELPADVAAAMRPYAESNPRNSVGGYNLNAAWVGYANGKISREQLIAYYACTGSSMQLFADMFGHELDTEWIAYDAAERAKRAR